MIRKEDWDAIYRDHIAAGQKRIGPPTFEEVEKLSRGQLSDEEAERVRESLSFYPDLLKTLSEPFPSDDVAVSEHELAASLAKIRARARRPVTAQWVGVAAGVVVVMLLGGLWIHSTSNHPRPLVTQVIYSERDRGGQPRGVPSTPPVSLSKDADYLLKPVFDPPRPYRDYRIELLDVSATPPRRIWIREHVTREADGTYPIRLSTEDLERGLYRLVLYGIDGTIENLAQYSIRLKDAG